MTKISIIIPVYNIDKYLSRCIESCIKQSLKDIEIICINDGSTDTSQSIIDHYILNDSRLKKLSIKNAGAFNARMAGVEIAKGRYIYFLDGDDFLENDAMEKLWICANKSEANIISGKAYELYENGAIKIINDYDFELINGIDFLSILLNGPIYLWGHLFESNYLKSFKIIMPKRIDFSEDLMAMIQLAYNAAKVSYCNSCIQYYCIHQTSVTKNMNQKYANDALSSVRFTKNYILSLNVEKNIEYKIIAINIICIFNIVRYWDSKMLISEDYDLITKNNINNIAIANYLDNYYKRKLERYLLSIICLNASFIIRSLNSIKSLIHKIF